MSCEIMIVYLYPLLLVCYTPLLCVCVCVRVPLRLSRVRVVCPL